ncbi:MAG TPA: tetratricopeptide repeat protein [Polyangia bacterium]|nr:tetratricopeptide repeat protein [Polyangia bacterium]
MVDSAALASTELREAAFVGRRRELELLDAALSRAARFQAPQIVTVMGPLGIGKTRLVREWLETKATAGLRVVAVEATEETGPDQRPYGLVAALLRRRFGLDAPLPVEEAMARFRGELQRVFGDRRVAEVAALLGGFLGFEMPESPLVRALAGKPEQGADLARAVLCRFLERDAAPQPLVLICEDLQRADEASLELLHGLAGELGEARIVLIATARPDLVVRRSDWGEKGSHARIELAPLGRGDVERMTQSILAVDPEVRPRVDPALLDRAAQESGGNPFLLRQLLDVYQRHGVLAAPTGESWWFDFDGGVHDALPLLTPEQAAESRIGQLTPAERDVLGRGAAFGPVFWTGGVVALGRLRAEPADPAAVFGPDPAIGEIRQILDGLAARDYLVRLPTSTLPSDTEWGFRRDLEHGLIESSVDPDLMRRRRAFAAQWLESRGGEGREERLEALGHLYEQAGDPRRAAYCFITAAARARKAAQLDRARVLYLGGIRLLDNDDALARMDALHAVGDVAARLGRTREAVLHFQDMLRVAWRLDLPAKGGVAHDRIGRLCGTLGDHPRALAHLDLARALFQAAGDLPGVASALDDIGRIHFLGGAPEQSLECHRAALAVRERLGDQRGRALALARMGEVEHETGDLSAAGVHLREALALRRVSGDRQGVVASLLDVGSLERDLGHLEDALTLLEEGRTLARDIGERLYECSLGVAIGDCHLDAGQPREALREFLLAKEIARGFGAKLLLSEAARGVAEAELALGDAIRAGDEARAAFDLAQRIGAPPLAGAALRVAAAAVRLGAPGESDLGGAREMFDRAVELLSNAGAEMELGRALSAYADFEESGGRRHAAEELRRQSALIVARARRATSSPLRPPS